MSSFQQARRAALKGRVALCGPTGSGKTWTALGWARQLGEPVALIDTERRSASLYADEFKFDTCAIDPPYHPQKLIDALHDAAEYPVVVCDSISHFWEGRGGILEMTDAVAARSNSGNKYVAWGVTTPIQQDMVDAILSFPGHIIVTMRSKMDYLQDRDEKGKPRIVKVGMAPVQRNGVEYEFTVIGDLDQEHRLVISKSRCHPLADRVIAAGRQEDAAVEFRKWLEEGDALADPVAVGELVELLGAIVDDKARAEAKRAFVAQFGPPDLLTEPQLKPARDWVAEEVA